MVFSYTIRVIEHNFVININSEFTINLNMYRINIIIKGFIVINLNLIKCLHHKLSIYQQVSDFHNYQLL